MIFPKRLQTSAAVAAHYDELDSFYREIWGEHIHHGYWATGRETAEEAVLALVELLADRLRCEPGHRLCDIGCGYGATARMLAGRHAANVTGVTISRAQAEQARSVAHERVCIVQQDWLTNGFAADYFDRIYAIESSEHMPDKQRFFSEAFRTLKPGGVFVVCAWLAGNHPRRLQVRHLLEPICREGRLPSMGNQADYQDLAEAAGFRLMQTEDITDRVARTWWICIRRGLAALITDRRYRRFLLDRTATERSFAVTMLRIMIAYRSRSMRYCLMVFRRDA